MSRTRGAVGAGKIPKMIFALTEPAVWAVATRLFILTTGRKGSKSYKPTVGTFYETGIVTSLYEALLMSPALAHMEIRHEMPYKRTTGKGAPKQVDLWLRPHNGGHPILIEAGDFSVGKVHRDLQKITDLNAKGSNWFLAFFRSGNAAADPLSELQKSYKRSNGLKEAKVRMDKRLVRTFKVFRPGGSDDLGAALLRGV